tara:strand:- start:1007 stop:1531 length:525 start_codon:yes stop_codon:yes gene_type:complete
MQDAKRETGKVSKNKLLRRQQNLLNLVYLEAVPMEDGCFKVPAKVFTSIETELDFNPPPIKGKKNREEEVRKRFRKRDTYRFWTNCLALGNIPNEVVAKEFLMTMFRKFDEGMMYGSMTHSRYALETLELALDDHYGTNNCILVQHKFNDPIKKKKSKVKNDPSTDCDSDGVPF